MTNRELQRENDALRRRLAESEETLAAIREGRVDAIVVDDAAGARIFSLSGAETVYRLAVETMAEAALNVTPDGTILFCNARFGQFVATPIERLVGQDLAEFVAADHRAELRELLRRCLHEPVNARIVLCGPGHQRTPARLAASALTQPGGEVSLCLVAADLTELEDSAHQIERLRQVQAELRESRRAALDTMQAALEAHWEAERAAEAWRQSEARFRSMADSSPAIIWTADPAGSITFHNQRWLDYTGIAPADNERDWPALVLHPDDRERCVREWTRALQTGSDYEIEVRNRRRDGEYRWFLTRATPVRDEQGRVIGWCGSSSDIHEHKQAQAALLEADRHKDEFLAMLAHELRNPLAPIRTSVALFKSRELADPLLARGRDIIDRQVSQMARLLDDLLDVSRLSRGKLALQLAPVHLRDALSAAIEATLPLIEQREQELTVEGLEQPIMLTADLTRLTQVFGNLLNNASKYSPPRARIGVSVMLEGGSAVVRVRDTGAGIASEMLPAVFELFTQAETSQRLAPGGLGIGLALARRLIELHDGSIAAHSDGIGCGSVFTVRVPAAADARALEPVASARVVRSVPLRRRVLVADDNADAADTIATLLGELGCEVRTVYGGRAALREAERFRPELVLLDLGMPDLDGREVCRQIRAQPWGADMELVALTGWGRENDRQLTKAVGFDHHLVKPVDPELLVQLVARCPRSEAV